MKYKSRHLKAFTLIEILIVLLIISILLTVIAPALIKIKSKAKALLCQSNLRQISIGLESYQFDNRSYAPFLGIDPTEF